MTPSAQLSLSTRYPIRRAVPAMLPALAARGMLAMAALLSTPGPAAAGAWTRAEGTGQVIVASGRQVAPIGAFAGATASNDKSFLQLYAEYGVIEGTTVGIKVFSDLSTTDLGDGSAAAALLLRQRLWQDESGNVASVELIGALPFERFISDALAASNPDSTPEVQVNALYGTSWWGDWGSAFLSTSGGYAWRSEGTADELRGEVTGGYRWRRCCLVSLSAFTTQPLSGPNEATLKLAPAFAYTPQPLIGRNALKPRDPLRVNTIQFSINYDVLNTSDGLGFQVAYWRPF